jgi:hypothetical protein
LWSKLFRGLLRASARSSDARHRKAKRGVLVIDVFNEDLIDLRDACRSPAFRNPRTKKAAHVSQAYRWVSHGARAADGNRVKLEVVRTPSGLRTSREAVVRFLQRLTCPASTAPEEQPARVRQIEAAVKELRDAKLM